MPKDYLFTSESVTEGHPDKICDQISDGVVDALIAKDPHARIAVETLVKTGFAIVAGEVTTNAWIDIPTIVRTRSVDRVVVSLADARGRLDMFKLLEIKLSGVTFDHLATVYEEYTGKIAVENLRPSWMIFSEGFRKSKIQLGAKRLLGVALRVIDLVLQRHGARMAVVA